MINKQRVRRIKNLIYAFIILVLFLPLILMSILSFRMIGLAQKMSDKLDGLQVTASSQTAASSSDGYVIEPEGQSSKNGSIDPQDAEEKNQGNANGQTPAASGSQPEANGAAPSKEAPASDSTVSGDQSQPSAEAPEKTGINNDNTGKLNQGDTSANGGLTGSKGETAGAGGGGLGENPGTGGGIIRLDPDGNPLTGR